jgi:hypothetical protein
MDNSFPSHNIDPRKKDKAWGLQFNKAAWKDSEGYKSIFHHYAAEYDRIKSYALGRQKTSYKKAMHIDEQSNTTWAVLDFKILPIVKKHRQLALGRLQKNGYNIVCTPIDALARTDADQYYAETKAKILLRNELLKAQPELADSPMLKPQAGEPLDLEELEMQMDYGYKHNYAIEAEEGIELIFDQNNISECRHKVIENLFDYGVAAVKEWMEPSGKVRFRRCDVGNIITNYCRYDDFRDLTYVGEVVDYTWTQFREDANSDFTEEQFETIFNASKSGNQGTNAKYGDKANDKFKVKVLELEWFSVNEHLYEDRVNHYGNQVFGKARYKSDGAPTKENYRSVKRQVVYRSKWVVGTDFIYGFGLAPYQKRNKGLTNTDLSYHFYATNFHDMRASGVMEDIIPIADQMAVSWLKLQNIRNELKPYYVDIDLDALEDVPLGKGGAALTPKEILEMWSQNGILVTRRKGISQNNPNYKTIEYVATNYGQAIAEAWNDFNNHLALLKESTGFNEATDGSTINPKTLNPAVANMNENTNNALYHITHGEEVILLSLAEAVLCRMKRAIKEGKVEGYIEALGYNTIKFVSVSPDVSIHDFGIKLENKPTPEQKNNLQQLLIKYTGEGLLEPIDNITVENVRNLKQAEQILAFRVKKRKDEQQQKAIALQQQNGQIQIQSAQATAQMDMQKTQLEYTLKMQLMDKQKQWDYEIEKLRQQGKMMTTAQTAASNEKMQSKEMGEEMSEPMNDIPIPQE